MFGLAGMYGDTLEFFQPAKKNDEVRYHHLQINVLLVRQGVEDALEDVDLPRQCDSIFAYCGHQSVQIDPFKA